MATVATMALVGSLALMAGTGAIAHHQRQDALANVEVIPADTPRAEVFRTMKHFSQALGVRCTYCHIGEEGQPLSTFDFASDEKWQKGKAREMLKLVRNLNAHHFTPEGEEARLLPLEDNKVTCYTCHRGSTKPAAAIPAPPEG